MNGTLAHADADADERALATALLAAVRRYRGDAESDDGQADGFMAALAARFDAGTHEIVEPHTARARVP